MTAVSSLVLDVVSDWTAEGTRPVGQHGHVNREHRVSGWSYPAVKTPEGHVIYWRDGTESAGEWLLAPTLLAKSFEPAEEWRADCDHLQGVPYRTCDTQSDCVSLRREQERTWGR